jgi:hypothetical protein
MTPTTEMPMLLFRIVVSTTRSRAPAASARMPYVCIDAMSQRSIVTSDAAFTIAHGFASLPVEATNVRCAVAPASAVISTTAAAIISPMSCLITPSLSTSNRRRAIA